MRGMARRVWLAGWASHRLELTATSPLIDLCTPVGKHTRGRPGKSRSCDGQGRRSVVTDKAGDHVTQHDARPALARSAPTHQAPVGYSPRGVSKCVPRFDSFPRGIFKTPSVTKSAISGARMAKTWGKNRPTGRFGPADLCLSQTSEPRPPGFRLHFSVRNWTLENRALGVAVGIRTHGGDGPTEVSWCCGGRVGRQT